MVGGGDASYIMGSIQPPIHLPETENITIVVRGGTGGGPMAVDVEWCRDPDNEPQGYQCVVASPKKESKLKGLKSFIAYQITPTVCLCFTMFLMYILYLYLSISHVLIICVESVIR